jgi:SsrA-binding protein
MGVNIVNRKAKFEYTFERTEKAGMVLFGSEVKAIRNGKCSLVDAYCIFEDDEIFIKSMNIPIEGGKAFSHEPGRSRKLLLKRKEINKLQKDLVKGLTIIPYRIFETDKGLLKIEICLAKGKKLYDKRNTIKERDLDREQKKDI